MQIRLTTLGAARVHRGDTDFPDLPAQRLRFALLLYLAVEQDVSRDEVVAMFWPDRDTARGKHALRQMLYELRQVLGEDWVEMRRDRIVVTAAIDAIEFEHAIEAGRVEEALQLYGGAFLFGFSLDNRSFESWVDRRGGHLARLHRRVQREHIGRLVGEKRTEEALASARRWVELDPLDDEAAHALIERLVAAGHRAAALQFYDHYERQLAAELQVEPLEDTQALVAGIRNGAADPAASPARQAPAADVPVSGPSRAVGGQSASGRGAGAVRRRPVDLWRAASAAQRSIAAALVAAAVLGLGLYSRAPAASSAAARGPLTTIAVLPFADSASDASIRYLGGALSDALASGLAKSGGLSVIGPAAVRELREQGRTTDRQGRTYNADYLVRGTLSRDGDQLRLDVELLDGHTREVVRSHSSERGWSESRNLVEDVVLGAAIFLRGELGQQINIGRAKAGTTNEAAWRLLAEANAVHETIVTLLEARAFDDALNLLTTADSLLAVAARLDPEWPEPVLERGWLAERRALIARIAALGGGQARGMLEARRTLESGLALADLAAQTGRDPAGVHALRGALLQQMAQLPQSPDSILSGFAEAELELVRATELDSLDQGSWRRLANIWYQMGRYAEANAAAETAYRLDPYGPHAAALTYLRFNTLFEMGRDREAEGWCFQGKNTFPDDLIFAYCLLALHAWADGITPEPDRLRQEMARFEDGDADIQPSLKGRFESMIAAAYARAGQPDSARAILRRVARAAADPGNLWMRASVHAALGEDSTALELLGQYLEVGGWSAPRVAASRPFHNLLERSDLERLIAERTAMR